MSSSGLETDTPPCPSGSNAPSKAEQRAAARAERKRNAPSNPIEVERQKKQQLKQEKGLAKKAHVDGKVHSARQRINYLQQLSIASALLPSSFISSSPIAASSASSQPQLLGMFLGSNAESVRQKLVLKLTPAAKQLNCSACHAPLLPGRVRCRSKPYRHLVITCPNCQATRSQCLRREEVEQKPLGQRSRARRIAKRQRNRRKANQKRHAEGKKEEKEIGPQNNDALIEP
ncbi:MAG: ribonuclease P Rpr2/Rpp21/SNM1 subunit [archaeon]|nr:ribonuclease P Rpr2/Rpp21/SNM1 subunit [archaeon]